MTVPKILVTAAQMSQDTIGSDECAELLRCTPEQVEELARAGEIPGLKFGRSWIFVRGDLLTFLAEKARAEAQERRARRAPGMLAPITKPRRQTPPMLPTPPVEGSALVRAHDAQAEPQSSPPSVSAARPSAMDQRLLLTAAEAAKMLTIGQSTFWNKVRQGLLPKAVKIGGLTRWRVADLQRCIDADGEGSTRLP